MVNKHPKPASDLLIFLPTYNERRNVAGLVSRIQALPLKANILFIDDNSPDGTGAVLDRLSGDGTSIHVIHRSSRQGIGSAHLRAIRFAYEQGYQTLITLDADGTHAPEDIPRLLVEGSTGTVVVGSRFLSASVDGRNRWQRLQSLLAHRLTALRFRLAYDMTNAFRLYRLDKIAPAVFSACRSAGYGFFPDSLSLLRQAGYVISQVPVHLHPRLAGKSKKRIRDVGEWLWRPLPLRGTKERSSGFSSP